MTAAHDPPVEISALIERLYNIPLFPEQDSLRGHGDSTEMAAAVTERLTDHHKFFFANSFTKISG